MLKINENITNSNQLPEHVNQHLSFLSPLQIKWLVVTFVLVFLDLGVLPLLYPKITIIYYTAIPLLAIAHLWAIRLLIKNPYSTQFESVLFMGGVGAIGTICYFILMQKIAYINLGIRAPIFYIISTGLFLLAYIYWSLVFSYITRYTNIRMWRKRRWDQQKKNKEKVNRPNTALLSR